MTASFAETSEYGAAEASSAFTINKLGTTLTLAPTTAGQYTEPTPVVATLRDAAGRALPEKTVFFVVDGPGGPYRRAIKTDYQGRAPLPLALATGSYTFQVTFGQTVSLGGSETLALSDDRYSGSTASLTLNNFMDTDPPMLSFLPNQVVATTNPAGAVVTWTVSATDGNPLQPSVTCRTGAGAVVTSGSVFPSGITTVTCSATDAAGNTATRSFTVKVYRLAGFYQPVDMSASTTVYNTVKGGATVPVKFELFLGSTEIIDPAQVAIAVTRLATCEPAAAEDAIETTTTSPTSLRYDTTSGQFIYNWKTPREPGKCYRVTMTAKEVAGPIFYPASFNASSALIAYFKLK
jgi:hypothetical protein